MAEGALPVGVAETAEDEHPALVERVEQRQRDLDRRIFCFRQFCPAVLHIGTNRRFVFGKRQLEPNVGVHVAVRDVMRDLTHGPSAVAVWRVQLRIAEIAYDSAQPGGSLLDVGEELLFLLRGERALKGELANGETRVRHGVASGSRLSRGVAS